MIDAQLHGAPSVQPESLAPSSHYLELVVPAPDLDRWPRYQGGHFLHMLAVGPKNVGDIARHLCLGPAAAQEMLDEHVAFGLVIEEAGLYSLNIHAVLNLLTSMWPKLRWQEELLARGEWDCRTCLVPGDR